MDGNEIETAPVCTFFTPVLVAAAPMTAAVPAGAATLWVGGTGECRQQQIGHGDG
jgi:hypothetical protein